MPEWYFLPFYAILRSIPSKVGGILGMFGSIVVLFFLPFTNTSKVRSASFRPAYRTAFWFLFFIFIVLGWIGQAKVDTPFIEIGQVATFFYFSYFLIFFPLIGSWEYSVAQDKELLNSLK